MSDPVANEETQGAGTESKGFVARMQRKWGVTPVGVVAILIAFALAGSTVLKISGPILRWMLPADHPNWLWWVLRIVIIVPIYEVLLLCFGTLLGQRAFFWNKQKALFRRMFGRR
jgi:hypothetical protein